MFARKARPRPFGWLALGLIAALLAGPVELAAGDNGSGQGGVLADALFAAEIQAAAETRTTGDDLELAGQMLDVARSARGDAQIVAAICHRVLDLLTTIEGGEDMASEATAFLLELGPSHTEGVWSERVVMLREQLRTAGAATRRRMADQLLDALLALAEAQAYMGLGLAVATTLDEASTWASRMAPDRQGEIDAALAQRRVREQAAGQIAAYQTALEADPADDQTRRELVHLLLVVMDDPVLAAAHLGGLADEVLQTYVPLAADREVSSPAVMLELARWYRQLADECEDNWRPQMLRRAEGYLRGSLAMSPPAEIRQEILSALEDVMGDASLGAGPALAGGREHNVMAQVDLSEDVVLGTWRADRAGAVEVREGGMSVLRLPVAVSGSYALKVRVIRTTGNSGLIMLLPVGARHVMLIIDHDGVSGLSMIDGQELEGNNPSVVREGRLSPDRAMRFEIHVRDAHGQASIEVLAAGRRFLTWSGAASSLALPGNFSARQGHFGIGSLGSGGGFGEIALRIVDGQARWSRPPEGR